MFLIPTALLFHNFWTFSHPAQRATSALFALFSVAGPGQFAITGTVFNLR